MTADTLCLIVLAAVYLGGGLITAAIVAPGLVEAFNDCRNSNRKG